MLESDTVTLAPSTLKMSSCPICGSTPDDCVHIETNGRSYIICCKEWATHFVKLGIAKDVTPEGSIGRGVI